MKKIIAIALLLCMMLSLTSFANAEISGDPVVQFNGPVMITNAGQGPGGKMGRLLFTRTPLLKEEADYFYVDVPYAADVDVREWGAIFIVIGSTDKGLGATGITIDEEIARVNEVVARAKEKEIPVVAVMLEKDKRNYSSSTNANERCIDAVCPFASWIVVIKDVNAKDQRFDAFKAANGTPLTILDTSMDFIKIAEQSVIPVAQ